MLLVSTDNLSCFRYIRAASDQKEDHTNRTRSSASVRLVTFAKDRAALSSSGAEDLTAIAPRDSQGQIARANTARSRSGRGRWRNALRIRNGTSQISSYRISCKGLRPDSIGICSRRPVWPTYDS